MNKFYASVKATLSIIAILVGVALVMYAFAYYAIISSIALFGITLFWFIIIPLWTELYHSFLK